LLAPNGLRVSEATGADIEHLGLDRGHRTLTITRKGGKVVMIPLAPRTARAIDLAIGERTDGPVFLTLDGRRLDRHGAGRIVRKVARRGCEHQGRHTAPAQARVHYRRAGCRGPAARCPRGCLPC
jgi:integrase/recombinase XerD